MPPTQQPDGQAGRLQPPSEDAGSLGGSAGDGGASPARRGWPGWARAGVLAAAVVVLPLPVLAATIGSTRIEASVPLPGKIQFFLKQLTDPWTWFGLCAQGLFFLRFFWQWIVSEKHKRSIVPVAFWYFSLTGAISMCIYGAARGDLVVMLSGMIPCPIYVRNLVLIYGRAERRRRAGLPPEPIGSNVTDEDLPG